MKSFPLIQTICFSTGIFINFNYKINDRRTRSNISGFHMHVPELALSNAHRKTLPFFIGLESFRKVTCSFYLSLFITF